MKKQFFQVVIFALILTPLLVRMLYVEYHISEYTGVKYFSAIQVLANDSLIFLAILVLIYLSAVGRKFFALSVLLRMSAFSIYLICVANLLVIVNFNTHLTWFDFCKYAPYAPKYIRQTHSVLGVIIIFVLFLLFLSLALWLILRPISTLSAKQHLVFRGLLIVLAVLSMFTRDGTYVHSWAYKNIIAYNLTAFAIAEEYSDEFTKSLASPEVQFCKPGKIDTPNIIIAMVESFSPYQSKLFSGIRDWTPNLDEIASKNVSFMNFYANGFATEDAEIALLTGLPPLYPPSSYSAKGSKGFDGFYSVSSALPHILNDKGYKTEFITSANLGFLNTGVWAKSIGFKYIEGHEHSYYETWDRYHFNAAPDEALYDRVMDRIRQNRSNRFFIFLKTTSTHHPHINPENNHKSEEESFRYADKQFGAFYEKLIEMGFFEKGLLIIVGDHHAMLPLKKEEIESMGAMRASAMVPMILAYKNRKSSTVHDVFQQVDVHNSLKNLVMGERCISDWAGDFINKDYAAAKYVIYRRGDSRDIVSVFTEDSIYSIKLNGDDTKIVGSDEIDFRTARSLLDRVNCLRSQRESLMSPDVKQSRVSR